MALLAKPFSGVDPTSQSFHNVRKEMGRPNSIPHEQGFGIQVPQPAFEGKSSRDHNLTCCRVAAWDSSYLPCFLQFFLYCSPVLLCKILPTTTTAAISS